MVPNARGEEKRGSTGSSHQPSAASSQLTERAQPQQKKKKEAATTPRGAKGNSRVVVALPQRANRWQPPTFKGVVLVDTPASAATLLSSAVFFCWKNNKVRWWWELLCCCAAATPPQRHHTLWTHAATLHSFDHATAVPSGERRTKWFWNYVFVFLNPCVCVFSLFLSLQAAWRIP